MIRLFSVCLLLISVSVPVHAQNALGTRQTGVIQDLLGNGPGEIVISGTLYNYDNEITRFTLRGDPIADADLELGMVVRFTVRDGILQQVEVLGPNNLVEGIAPLGVLD